MNRIAGSLAYGFFNMLHPGMLWLMVWPMLLSLFAWGTVALLLWTRTALWLAAHLRQWLESGAFLIRLESGDAVLIAAQVLMFLLLVPLVYLTALLILGVFGMPAVVDYVAARRYPALERRRGGSLAGSLVNGLAALAGLVALGAVSIPFWVIPPLWPLLPIVIMGWVNQRLLRYDALAEHASAAEMRAIFASRRKVLYALGAVLALLAYVPVIGFFAPVLFGLAFVHHLLGELQALRRAPISGEAVRL